MVSEFGVHTYKFWIEPLKVKEISDNTLELIAPNVFFSDWIRERYVDKILQFLKDAPGREYQIKLSVAQESPNSKLRKLS